MQPEDGLVFVKDLSAAGASCLSGLEHIFSPTHASVTLGVWTLSYL